VRVFIIIFLSTVFLKLNAQDIHFSQFKNSKININPALTGDQESDYLAILQRRSQWGSVTDPFKTISIAFYRKDIYKQYSFAIEFLNDVAGLSDFATTGFNASSSLKLLNNKDQVFSFGLGLGAFQRSYDFNSLTFYENEQFIANKLLFVDLFTGIFYQKKINTLSKIDLGFSAYHINNPNQSFTSSNENTPAKYITHIDYNLMYNDFNIIPSVFYSYQANQKEFIFGLELTDQIKRFNDKINLSAALYCRYNDAVIPSLSFSFEKLDFNISYDVNISDFSKASNNFGGLEFAVMYHWNKKKVKNKNKFICPRYL